VATQPLYSHEKSPLLRCILIFVAKKTPFFGSTLVYPTNSHEIPHSIPIFVSKKSPTKPTFPWKSSFNQLKITIFRDGEALFHWSNPKISC